MARPENIRTPLGHRLTLVRKQLNYKSRKEFASIFPIAPDTLGTYERGVSEPNTMVLTLYYLQLGINLNWLITGEGAMFNKSDDRPTPLQKINVKITRCISDLVTEASASSKLQLSPKQAVETTVRLYNELLERVVDINDEHEVEAVYPQLKIILSRILAQTAHSKLV